MAIPAIPAHGANWDGWAAGVDTAARNAAQIPDVATAGTPTGDALRAAFGRVAEGPSAPSLPPGTEYVWFKTDGAGTLLDIVSGIA